MRTGAQLPRLVRGYLNGTVKCKPIHLPAFSAAFDIQRRRILGNKLIA